MGNHHFWRPCQFSGGGGVRPTSLSKISLFDFPGPIEKAGYTGAAKVASKKSTYIYIF